MRICGLSRFIAKSRQCEGGESQAEERESGSEPVH